MSDLPFICRHKLSCRFATEATCKARHKLGLEHIRQHKAMLAAKYPEADRYGGLYEYRVCGACEGPIREVEA
jgi:hypothetical protein